MGNIRVRKETGLLYFDFFYQGVRCREQTRMQDSSTNRKRLEKILVQIEKEMETGVFSYGKYFPGSKNFARVAKPDPETAPQAPVNRADTGMIPTFKAFAEE